MPHAAIKTRPIDQDLYRSLQSAGADPLLARLFAPRRVRGADELGDSLTGLIPYAELANCTEAARRLADAVENG